MHKITLLFLGESKPQSIATLVEQYVKWCGQFADVTVQILKEAKVRAGAVDSAMREDTESMLRAVPSHAQLIVLDNLGKQMTTEVCASWIGAYKDQGVPLVFAVGGAYGFDRTILAKHPHVTLSLSSMVTTHQLVRVMLAEQLYRVMTILAGKEYHHG